MNNVEFQNSAQSHAIYSVYEKLVWALPRGRIIYELGDMLPKIGITPEQDFFDSASRKLSFSANDGAIDLLTVRAFDVATYVAAGGAHLGIVGSDVLQEFNYNDIYMPIDLNIGHCRMVLAAPKNAETNPFDNSIDKVTVASKYPNITKNYFAARGIRAECIKLHGALELAPKLGLASYIVDLVSTGSTLKANDLVEIATIANVTSRLIVNRTAWKTRNNDIIKWIEKFEEVCHGA